MIGDLGKVGPQFHADNLKCDSARFASEYIVVVGHAPASSIWVQLSANADSRHDMRSWVISSVGECWNVECAKKLDQFPRLVRLVFIVALYVPWCRYLAGRVADNLKCTTTDDAHLLAAARFTDRYIRAVGQEASPGKCVLLSTSQVTRKRMKDWSISYGDKGWAVKLDVRDLGGHLDVTNRARAHTLSCREDKATAGVHLVSALLGCLRLIGFARSKFLPAGLHGCEGAPISIRRLDSFRTATVRACWPRKLPMGNPHAVLSFLDAPDVADPALYVIWNRFRHLMRYLSYRPGEVARVHKLVDLVAAGSPGPGSIHILLESAAEVVWDSGIEGWVRPGLPPLRMMAAPISTSSLQFAVLGELKCLVFLLCGKGFGVVHCWTTMAPCSFFCPPN